LQWQSRSSWSWRSRHRAGCCLHPKKLSVAQSRVRGYTHQQEVFGFALASSLADPTVGYPSWNFDFLSHRRVLRPARKHGGSVLSDLGWSTWNSPALTNLVSLAHQHGVKVVLTVVLQDFSANTPSMCAGLQHADATAAQTVIEVKQRRRRRQHRL